MKKYTFFFIALLSSYAAFSQIAVNTDGSSPAASAIVDIKSNSKGFLPPRLSQSKRDSVSNPAEGLVIYDTTLKSIDFYDGNRWVSIRKGGIYISDTALFQIAIGSDKDESAKDIALTPDGGFMISGNSANFSGDNSNPDYLFVKLTEDGYFDTYGNSYGIYYAMDNVHGSAVCLPAGSGYLNIANGSNSNGKGFVIVYRFGLRRIAKSDLSQDYYLSGDYTFSVSSVVQTDDHHFFYAGQADQSESQSNPNAIIFETDSIGNVVYNTTKYVGRNGSDNLSSILKTSDGAHLLAAGYSYTDNNNASDFFVVKIDTAGNFDPTFGTGGIVIFGTDNSGNYNIANTAVETADGGYIIAGETNAYGAGGYDAFFVKLQKNGQLDKNFGNNGTLIIGGSNNEIIYKIISTDDGNYVAVGESYTYNIWTGIFIGDIYVVKITPRGGLVTGFGYNGSGGICIGGSGDESGAYSVVETDKHALVIAGYTESFGSGGKDIYIVKLNENGLGCGNTSAAGVTVNSGGGSFHGSCSSGTQSVFSESAGIYKFANYINITRVCN